MPKNAAHGRIVWHELATTDRDGARSFYTQITPWKTAPWEDAKNYELLTLDNEPIGGLTQIKPERTAKGIVPHWLPFVCVYDVDETVRQAGALGGTVRHAPREVPHVGCWAVVADPGGGAIGVFEPADQPPGDDDAARVGEFSWHELATDDYKAAADFYRSLFRWEKTSEYDMGEMGIYYMFGRAGQVYGGIFKRPPQIPGVSWLSYVRVENVKPIADRVKALGGMVMNGPMEVPGGDWIAQCADPQGAAFALHAK
jgi:predicted enzyme related to lactoylglutathione lyase